MNPVLVALAVFFCVFAMMMMVLSKPITHTETRVVCKTKGATLLSKSDNKQLYLTYYCVKDGVVVP